MGRWFESAIGSHLLNQCLASGSNLYYWRDGDDEVDFIIEGIGKTTGIEVKTSIVKSASGMSAFKKRYHPDRVLFVGQTGIRVEEFLELAMVSLIN